MKKIFWGLTLLALTVFVTITEAYSQNNLSAKWYLVYKVQGGTIQKVIGPFNTQFECEAARYTKLPFGAEYIGCYQ
jgi:hypothetical protein